MPEALDINPSEYDEGSEKKEEFRKILDKILAREKAFEDGWWKDAETAVKLYDGGSCADDSSEKAYNILYSNTEVLLPSLYSATPKPDVRSRYLDQDLGPVPKAIERFLAILSDPAAPGTENLDDAMSETVLSALVPGMGFARLRYYPDKPMPLRVEAGHYKGLIWAKGRKWSKLPWIAFRHELSEKELYAQFKIPEEDRSKFQDPDKDSTDATATIGDKPNGTVVYEYIERASGKTCFLCNDWEDLCLREDENILQLDGVFPTPGPMLLTMQPGELNPVPLFQYYRNQAQELNKITVRLNKVISAIRVRGAYNGLLGPDMEKLLADSEMENALIPASEAAMLAAQGGGFERHIWMLPIEKLIEVATQLFQAREGIKAVIYELTGISDIIRGSSVASETATAQDLKNKWGTIRLRKMQTLVSNYVRDLYRISVDAATTVVPPQTWKAITQLPIPLMAEKQAAQQRLAQMQQMAQQAAMQAQAMGQPPQEPPPPPPELLSAAQSPSWEEILQQIAVDSNRTFLVNVQTSSTIDLDTAADKADVTEFMGALGQILPGLGQFVGLGPSGLEAAKAVLVGICSRYKFGLEMVPALRGIEAPPPPSGPDPEQQKQLEQAQAQIEQGKTALAQQEKQNQAQLAQIQQQTFALKEQAFQLSQQKAEVEAAIRDAQAQAKVEQISRSADMKVFQATKESAKAQITAASAQKQIDPEVEKAFEQYVVEHNNATKILTAIIAAQSKADAAEKSSEGETESESETPAIPDTSQFNNLAELHSQTLEAIKGVMEQLSRPKTIIRDADGRAQGIK
jgi:hypothetical protein